MQYSDAKCYTLMSYATKSGAGISQSVQRLATGWTVRGSNLFIQVAERPNVKVCGRSLAGITGSNPAVGMNVLRA